MFTSTLAEEKSELALICVALLGCIVGLLSGVLGILALKNSKKKKNKAAKLNAALSGEAVGRDFPAVDYQVRSLLISFPAFWLGLVTFCLLSVWKWRS